MDENLMESGSDQDPSAAHASPSTRSRWIMAGAGAAILLVIVLFVLLRPGAPSEGAPQAGAIAEPPPVSDAELKKLPKATTYNTIKKLPADPDPSATPGGTVVHPRRPVPVYDEPGGKAVAVLPAKQLDAPTWVPVVESRRGWVRVLLPSRPNGASGWLREKGMRRARTPYVIKVALGDRRMTIEKNGRPIGDWSVAIGKRKTPTPEGRTFVLALLAPKKKTYSPLILPLGSHSETLTTYGGGPGTVGFHGWPKAHVFGKAVTHGCVRVPDDALDRLSDVPLGSPVLVTT